MQGRELMSTSMGAEAASFITINCSVGMVDGDDRFHFGPPDLNVTSQFVFDAQGKLDAKRSAFNLGLAVDSAEARSRSAHVVDLAIESPVAVLPER
jgi:hypothetical protein